MVAVQSSTPGIYNQQTTTTGSGSHAQQAFAKQQALATTQASANAAVAGGGSKLKGSKSKYRGGADSNTITLAPMQSGTSPAQVALGAQVASTGAQSAANAPFDCHASNSCATKGGRRRSRTNKRKPRKTRRNHKKSKRRRTKSSRK
jgi:hypothetical protein